MLVYFVGIGGAGISPLAGLALDCDLEIEGSDMNQTLGTKEIEKRGVKVNFTQDGKYLEGLYNTKKIDWLVYTAAVKEDHPEIQKAKELGIRISKRDEFLNWVLKEKNLKLVAVAGTHGKTTTTSMMVWAIKQLGIPVSYLIGSQISFGQSSQYEKGSEYFILEADEFDRNFLRYQPEISLITNIDFDHPDIYSDQADYNQAFAEFLGKTSKKTYLYEEDFSKVVNLGTFDNVEIEDKAGEDFLDTLKNIKIPGQHNRENAYLVVKALCEISECSEDQIIEKISSFPGSTRRMEKIRDGLYSDYAHHPTEIAASLQMAQEINGDVVVVYQPHQNVRQHKVKELYRNCFDSAYKVFWLPTYLSREKDGYEILTPEELIKFVSNKEMVSEVRLDDNLKIEIERYLDQGKTVVCMGAGSIDGWVRENLS